VMIIQYCSYTIQGLHRAAKEQSPQLISKTHVGASDFFSRGHVGELLPLAAEPQ
jgi:hypothetical protein